MERVSFIRYEGEEILFLNFSDCRVDEAMEATEKAGGTVRSRPENSLRVLTDVTNGRFDDRVSGAMKELAANNKPYVKASAIVGITGLRKIIFHSVLLFSKRNIEMFDDLESAKKWLVTQ